METKTPQRVPEANAAGLVVGYSTASSNEEARAKSSEVLLIIKTQRTYTQAVVQAIKDKHSYEIPEVVFTDVVDGNPDYLEWVRAVTRSKGT
ncbi:CutA1 divalent ion tolerance domain-containing protein, putative [Eimeria mitis]|uniref:CutA1 divalent ion tolerance domain-containing protein, putative n=1 Tax=Eimeria mitis TaxID=44415 RepID=U6JNU6_9EIME|nr:CutA1 divalent ion tolerance domain-containing protein, putative [Eimeria mitis]CDJ27169.1 CutA1 divalent ion tolerance domain-containing protein, putative [Eimeria mitis]